MLKINSPKYQLISQNKVTNYGFTLVELLITMAVFAVGVSIAVPNYQSMVSSNRIVSQINNFTGSISFARSEAIKNGRTVSMVPTNVNNWASGWDIILPSNANQILGHVDGFSGNTVLVSNVALPVIQFTDEGRINTLANIVFTLCNSVINNNRDSAGRELSISPTGSTFLNSNYVCP